MELKRRREAGEKVIIKDNTVVTKLNRALVPNVHRDDTVTHSSATLVQATYNLHDDNSLQTISLRVDLPPFFPSVSADQHNTIPKSISN